jgi:hypothetical protein
MRKTLTTLTYFTLAFIIILILLVREKKISNLEHIEQQYLIQQEINKRDSINKSLHHVNKELKNEIDIIYSKNDSLMVQVTIKEIKLKEAKQQLRNDESNTILYAPDSTIIRILSEHDIITQD